MLDAQMKTTEKIGLIMSGGGARAAYQVGVLSEIAKIRREKQPGQTHATSPFQVICGTSAGAINGAALATRSDDFDKATSDLESIWSGMKAGQIYQADSWGVARSGARWLTLFSIGWALAKWSRARPRSLLDNNPLSKLLDQVIRWDRLPGLMDSGCLSALSIACSSYTNGEHHTFYQSKEGIDPWSRSSRVAIPTQLDNRHLMASSAIPFVFPAVDLGEGWFGDGSMRQSAPISPAVHLGARKLLVIGAGRMAEPPAPKTPTNGYPSLGQIAGHALSNIFLDALASDVERMGRINQTLSEMSHEQREKSALRPIDLLLIAPSQRLDDIAAKWVGELPLPVRAMLSALGVGKSMGRGGGAFASYLLFESAYTRELIELGKADARRQESDIIEFFGWMPHGDVKV